MFTIFLIMVFIFSGVSIQSEESSVNGMDDEDVEHESFIPTQPAFSIKKRTPLANERRDEFYPFHPYEEFEELVSPAECFGESDYFSKNLIVKGYITDNSTDLPISGALVFSLSYLIRFTKSLDSTSTDSNGYYEIAVNGRYNPMITARINGYYSDYNYTDYESGPGIIWMNFSLIPDRPNENSTFTINLYDNVTHFPLTDALVIIYSEILLDEFDMNYTSLDVNATNMIHCNNGTHRFFIYADRYFPYYSDYVVINESQERTIDFYLQPIPEENATITGVVKDFETDQPIQGATILLYWGKYPYFYIHDTYHNYTISNDSGIYEMNVAPGNLRLYAYAEGYFYEYLYNGQLDENEVRYRNFTLHRIPSDTAEVSGYILDNETGGAIENAEIDVEWSDGYGHNLENTTTSDDEGFYQINLPGGNISFEVRAEGYFKLRSQTYYINENETSVIDLILEPLPDENSIIFGFIKDEKTDDPIANADIDMSWNDDEHHYYENSTKSNTNGFYQMNIAAGQFRFLVYKSNYFMNYTDKFTIGDYEAKHLDIYLHQIPEDTSIIYGYVRDIETNQSISGAEIDFTWYLPENYWYPEFVWNDTTTDDNGFYMMNVPAGTFDLSTEKDGYYDEDSEQMTIGEYEAVQIDIFLYPIADENAMISGYILDAITNKPIHNASISLYWEDELNHSNQNATISDTRGYYEFNVAAGYIDYYVRREGYYSFYGFDEPYEINEFDEVQLNISLFPEPVDTAHITGQITNEFTDTPIKNAIVYARWKDNHGHYDTNQTETDAMGQYHINVPQGQIRIKAENDSYYSNQTDYFQVNESQILIKDLSLYPRPVENAMVNGHIYDSKTDQPITNAEIQLYWNDSLHHYDFNSTYSNDDGFYQFNVAAGSFDLTIFKEGYFWQYTNRKSIHEGEILTFDFNLDKKPKETATVYGYIVDDTTKRPIEDAQVSLYWQDDLDHTDSNTTFTDSTGYYSMNVAKGIISLNIYEQGYFSEHGNEFSIENHESIQLDYSLVKKPIENSIIMGYVTFEETENPMRNVEIQMVYEDEKGKTYGNSTFSNEDGFYQIHVPQGTIDVIFSKTGYKTSNFFDITIQSQERLWLNTSLYGKELFVTIITPGKGIYFNNRWIFPRLFTPLIIGDIEIEAYATPQMTKVEFYIDGFLKKTDTTFPYTYQWTKNYLLFHRHIIKVKAYDEQGNTDIDRMLVKKYF